MSMRAALFRSDASLDMGTGHVMRCLTLADALAPKGIRSAFACRPHSGHLIDLVRERGHEVHVLPAAPPLSAPEAETGLAHAAWLGTSWEADASQTLAIARAVQPHWLVVDHYALDARWESRVRPAAHALLVIDDLADRKHDCDLLLDQNLGRAEHDYAALVPPATQILAGAAYALLRPEFARTREHSLQARAGRKLHRILVSLGGVDRDDATGRVLEALSLCALAPDSEIVVVMGRRAPWLDEVRRRAAAMQIRTQVLVDVDNMAELMAESDLAIGAAGSTSWERCALGLPSVVVILADNQRPIAHALGEAGAAICMDTMQLRDGLPQLLATADLPQVLAKMSAAARQVTDGRGAERVADALCALEAA